MKNKIIKNYSNYYLKKKISSLYPTEFVVRSFLGNYPKYKISKNFKNKKILDLSFGDGKNIKFLFEQGFKVYGTEISKTIVQKCMQYLNKNKIKAELKVGFNSAIPYKNKFFNYVLACHSCYYLDESDIFDDNLREISRVLKKNGTFVGSVPNMNNYYFKDREKISVNKFKIKSDYLKIRNDCIVAGFNNKNNVKKYLSKYFKSINFGFTYNNFYGINENMIIFSCLKK